MEQPEVVEILGTGTGPTNLAGLNGKAINKLASLLDALDEKSNPEMITAVTDAVAKLNASLKNSDILPKEETEAERKEREMAAALKDAMNG